MGRPDAEPLAAIGCLIVLGALIAPAVHRFVGGSWALLAFLPALFMIGWLVWVQRRWGRRDR